MSLKSDNPYVAPVESEQAEQSSVSIGATNVHMRILIELQVQTMLMAQAFESTEDIRKLRQDVANSIA